MSCLGFFKYFDCQLLIRSNPAPLTSSLKMMGDNCRPTVINAAGFCLPQLAPLSAAELLPSAQQKTARIRWQLQHCVFARCCCCRQGDKSVALGYSETELDHPDLQLQLAPLGEMLSWKQFSDILYPRIGKDPLAGIQIF